MANNTQHNSNQDITVVFFAPREGSKKHKLADVRLKFNRGLLRGLELTGFTVWLGEKATGGEVICVTVPSNATGEGEDRKYYEFLRGKTTFLKAVIRKQYAAWAGTADVAEPAEEDERHAAEGVMAMDDVPF